MDLQGKWSGYYEYGPGYFYPFFGKRVEMEIIFTIDNEGRISGEFNETPSDFSVPANSTIKGFIEDDLISFLKIYDVRPEISEDGNSIIVKEGNLEVCFNGFIDKENKCIYGAWDLEDTYTENGEILMDYLSGIWMIKK